MCSVRVELDHLANMLQLVQLAHITDCSATMRESPFFSIFGREGRCLLDITSPILHVGSTAANVVFAQNTRDNLQIAFELARRNLPERATKKAAGKTKLAPYPVCNPGHKVQVR